MLKRFAVFVVLFLLVSSVNAEAKKHELLWLGHAAFQVTSSTGKKVLIDPFLTHNPKTPEKLKHYKEYEGINTILITHAHGDHVGDAISLANKFQIPVYAPAGLNDTFDSLGLLDSKLAPRFNKSGSVYPMGDAIRITMVRAEHSSEYKWKNPETGKQEVHEGGEPVGFIIELENGFKIYHMGDTGLFGDMALIGNYYKPDLVLIPIGGHFVMDPTDAAYAINTFLKPKFVVPMHYGTFPPLKGTVEEFEKALGNTNTKLIKMLPGDVRQF